MGYWARVGIPRNFLVLQTACIASAILAKASVPWPRPMLIGSFIGVTGACTGSCTGSLTERQALWPQGRILWVWTGPGGPAFGEVQG